MHNYYYGYIKNLDSIIEMTDIICETLDTPEVFPNSRLLMLETTAQETKLGLIKDLSIKAGMGLCQFDMIRFDDVKKRCKYKHSNKVHKELKININLVEWEYLRYSPFLSLLFCRLAYKLIPEEIPDSIESRWKYYKKYYNSYKGKAKKKEYLENAAYVKQLMDSYNA